MIIKQHQCFWQLERQKKDDSILLIACCFTFKDMSEILLLIVTAQSFTIVSPMDLSLVCLAIANAVP